MNKLIKHIGLYAAVLVLFSCGKQVEREGYHTVKQKIANRETDSTEEYGVSSLDHLEYLKTIKTDSAYTDGGFLIPERKSQIVNFQCTNCHTKSLAELKAANLDVKKAHWNIKLKHAQSSTMKCTTCHTADDMDNLHSLTDEKIDINHSYKVCAQCHSTQFKDWKIGAHGKRLGGWAPPRVSNTCVNCHNPHKPGFESRHPARYNKKMAKEHRKSGESSH